MSFFMATTQIAPEKTAMEISRLLGRHGASQILISYEDGEAVGPSFLIVRNGVSVPFRLPIKWEPVLKVMEKDKHTAHRLCHKDQAIKTSWRLVFRWVQAQLALVEAGAVDLEEVFFPYAQNRKGKTIYEIYSANQFKQLEAPKEDK